MRLLDALGDRGVKAAPIWNVIATFYCRHPTFA